MNKKNLILEELKRIQEIMYDKNLLNEAIVLGSLTREAVTDVVRGSIRAYIQDMVQNALIKGTKIAADESKFFIDNMISKGATYAISVMNSSSKMYDDVAKQAFNKAYRELGDADRLLVQNQVRTALVEANDEILKVAKGSLGDLSKTSVKVTDDAVKLADDATEEIAKQSPKTKAATWNAIKNHFGGNWKKYAAAGVLALIYANFYPDEEPPIDDDDVKPNPEPAPTPVSDKCPTYTNCLSPYKKCCKSEVIRKVQGCLNNIYGANLRPDGKFGPLTLSALIAAKFGETFTDEQANTICNVQTSPEPTPGSINNDFDGWSSDEAEGGQTINTGTTSDDNVER